MGIYDGWKQNQLQAELSSRQLSAAGSNDELKARLEENDAENDLLKGLDGQPPATPGPTSAAVDPEEMAEFLAWKQQRSAPAAASNPDETPGRSPRGTYIVKYPVRGELSTSMHEDNRQRAYDDAITAGHTPRGGLAAVCRIGWDRTGGKNDAIYEVTLTRQ